MHTMLRVDRIDRNTTVGSRDFFDPLCSIQSTSTFEFQWLEPRFDDTGPAVLMRATAESN
jgi:hypothetical protein